MNKLILPNLPPLSRIALGCDYYGAAIDEKIALSQLEYYVNNGGNILDTAHSYGQSFDDEPSSSERVIGKFLKETKRKDIFLITKGGHPHLLDKSVSRLDKDSLTRDILTSIETLETPVDLYFIHRDDENIPVEEIIENLNSFIKKGYTKYIGASNWSDERIKKANKYAIEHNLEPFTFSELLFSLAYCTRKTWGDTTIKTIGDGATLKFYEETKMPLLCFSSQGKGIFQKLLSNKVNTLSEKAKKRFLTEENYKRAERVKIISEKNNMSISEVVLGYIMSQKANTIAIIGSSRLEQIKDSLKAQDAHLSQCEIEFLDMRRDSI